LNAASSQLVAFSIINPDSPITNDSLITDHRSPMDLYIVLGLAHGATEADIKRAYRRLARRFHPDINPGDRVAEARFRQILDAYETLMDPQRRSRYDAGQGFEMGEQRPKSGFEGSPGSFTSTSSPAPAIHFSSNACTSAASSTIGPREELMR